jgi:ADP-heptose:LPS heptosyltransferase
MEAGRSPMAPPISRLPSSILLIKPGSLGDVVHALPVAAALHRAWPRAQLSWVIDPRWEPVLAGNPAITERIPFARERYRGPLGAVRAARWLADQRHRRPDLAIDLQCLLRSALIARASRARRVIGLSDAREGAGLFHHQSASVTADQHAVDRYLAVLPLLGLTIPDQPEFPLPAGDPIPAPESFVLLHPFARGAGKSLDALQIRYLCEHVRQKIVLVGMGDPPDPLPPNVTDLTRRTTLPQLIWLLRRAQSVISVDSGPMHLAAAIGARLLSIHTWSDPRRVGPYSPTAWIWQGGKLRPQSLTDPALPAAPIIAHDLVQMAAWAG